MYSSLLLGLALSDEAVFWFKSCFNELELLITSLLSGNLFNFAIFDLQFCELRTSYIS